MVNSVKCLREVNEHTSRTKLVAQGTRDKVSEVDERHVGRIITAKAKLAVKKDVEL